MFFRQKKSGNRVYLQIVENRWEQGKSKQRVIATLGTEEDAPASPLTVRAGRPPRSRRHRRSGRGCAPAKPLATCSPRAPLVPSLLDNYTRSQPD